MGLFTSTKKKLPPTDIPADILADVTVNGKKDFTASQPMEPSAVHENTPVTTSPFLTKAPETKKEEYPRTSQFNPVVNAGVPPEPEAPVLKPSVAVPKAPTSGEIHFTDLESPAAAEPKPALRPDFSQITQDKALTARQKEHLAPLKVGVPMPKEKKPLWSSVNILSFVVFILILGFISGGSWYYLNTRTIEVQEPEQSINALLEGEIMEEGNKTVLIDQPNYLSIDIETVTLEQVKALLDAEGEKMKAEGVTAPVEYLVVDTNSNPVAFSRFAFLVGADTPNTLVEASLEPFSLYLFLDQGALRMALAIALKSDAGANFPSNKGVLPESLKKFFLTPEYAETSFSNAAFKESEYQGATIFFNNVDEEKNISFDITNQEGILTVANSKNALRAVIDKRVGTTVE